MKQLLLTLTLLAISATANAQVSVITDSGQNDSNFGKKDHIVSKTENDVDIIKTKAQEWHNALEGSIDDLNKTNTDLEQVINELMAQSNKFRIEETDELCDGSGSCIQSFAKKDVPTCYGSTPRLAYQSGNWVCLSAVTCEDILGSNKQDWITDPNTGKCVKPAATWSMGNWGSCSSNRQSRSVRCKAVSTNKEYSDGACIGPKPLTSRPC